MFTVWRDHNKVGGTFNATTLYAYFVISTNLAGFICQLAGQNIDAGGIGQMAIVPNAHLSPLWWLMVAKPYKTAFTSSIHLW